MIDETQSTPEEVVEEVRPEIVAFKEGIAKANGVLLPLRKTTTDGKRLYVAARHLRNPWEYHEVDTSPGYYDIERKIKEGVDTTTVNSQFYGWEEERTKEGGPHMTGVVLVDIYTEQEGKIVPMGHMDWWLRDDYANGGGNMHQAPLPREEHEQEASKRWYQHDYAAFKVDYENHRQGLGSLMVATSAVVLPVIGIRRFYTGVLLEPAKKTYARFGIKESDFPSILKESHLPIERLSQNPQVDKTIGDFV